MADSDVRDVQSLLSSPERNFLVRNTGEQVTIESLKGKKVGLYFSASWSGPCCRFTTILVEVYNELHQRGDFELVFLSADVDEDSFNGYFSCMPWLAIPFFDSEKRDELNELFQVDEDIPLLIILDENGKVVTQRGVKFLREYGTEAFPFTSEKIKELEEQEEAASRDQSLKSLLVPRSRNFIITSDGKKVPVSELEGKTVGLYLTSSSYRSCIDFTPRLVEVYDKLKGKGESFEIVLIPLDDTEESFEEAFKSTPWISLPCEDERCEKLYEYFEISILPALVIIGPDGKTLHSNVADAIEEHGDFAYPFTPEKFAELAEIEKAREESQTLESLLVCGDQKFVLGKDGIKIPVSDLVGKNILLYFSAQYCLPCGALLPKLIETYKKIKAKDEAFEIIFISSDRCQASFNEYFSGMPWLALPFGDPRQAFLMRKFKVSGIPKLIAIGPTGRTVSKEVRDILSDHGADAYPFTDERLKEIEAGYEELAKGCPEKSKHKMHEHELVLTRRKNYVCDGCREEGNIWSYYCGECFFNLHPKCALDGTPSKEEDTREAKPENGWVCDGEVCNKA